MSRADQVAALITQAFPGVRITSTNRTPAEQAALVAAGKTRATNSQHLNGNGLDLVLPSNVAPSAIRSFLNDQGINPGEFLNESGQGANQGTGAHLHVGLAPKAGGQAPKQSTYDRVKAQQADQGPSLDAVFKARMNVGKPGGMTPKDAAAFDAAVADGHYMPPRWYKAPPNPAGVPVLPKQVIDAYNSHVMDDDPASRAEIERAVQAGEIRLPNGVKLNKPAPRSFGEGFGMGTRALMQGAGSLVDVVAGPINLATNAVAGTNFDLHPFRSLASAGADAMGLKQPESPTEQLTTAISEGGTQALLTAGAGTLMAGSKGLVGVTGEALAHRPILSTVSGGTAGGSQELARQDGAGPVGQLMAGLAGGLTPVGLAGVAERAAIRTPKTLPEVVAETPKAAMIDEAGNLTPHGQEVAARQGVTPDEIHAAYEAPPAVQRGVANDSAQPSVARAVGDGLPPEAPVAASEDPPVFKLGANQPTPDAPAITPDAVPPVARATPESVPPTALGRVENADQFGIPLSRGNATQDFGVQVQEQNLRKMDTPEGEAMRQFTVKQAEKINAAVNQFKQAVGDTGLTTEQRGLAVQDAMRELRNNGQKGVSELYKQAREMGAPVELDTTGIKNAYERLMVEADVPDPVKNVLTQEVMRYGLIGKPVVIDKATGAVTSETGITKVKLDNGDVKSFYGAPQKLGLDNAEEFRQAVSKQYMADGGQKLTRVIKSAIDDAVENAVENAAKGAAEGNVGEAFKAARAAHKEQVQTFKSKDVVQSIADWKRGAEGVTSVLSPKQVMAKAMGDISDLKKIKAVLLTKPTVASKAAWRAIQAHGVASILEKATVQNANIGGQVMEAISGAKLRSAVQSFGVDKLKVLLDPEDFNSFMALRRSIEDATIPINGTVPVGSAPWWQRLVGSVDNKVTAAFAAVGTAVGGPIGTAIGGGIGKAVGGAVKASGEAKQAAEVLSNATEYTAKQAAAEVTAAPKPSMAAKAKATGAKSIKAFIDIYKDPAVIAPILVSTEGSKQ